MSNSKQRILVVDDTPTNIDVIANMLSDDFFIQAATSGRTALKIIERKQPDLILLDIMMPEMSGYELCEILKKNDKTKYIPIVFITATISTEDQIKGFELGAADFISKPVNPIILYARIKTHLALKKSNDKFAQMKKITSLSKMVEVIVNKVGPPTEAIVHEVDELSETVSQCEQALKKVDVQIESFPRLYEQVKGIKSNVEMTQDLLKNLAVFACDASEEAQYFDINDAISNALDLAGGEIKSSIQLETNLVNTPKVMGNANQMQQVITNLVLNASQSIIDDGVVKVETSFGADDAWVNIKIEDNGQGIPFELQKDIFNPFFSTKNHFGLGLCISYCIAYDHGGDITYESTPNVGSTFYVRLPVNLKDAS